MTVSFITIMDIIGTIAFAISGAMVAIDQEMDIFGVNILAVTTAVGGGMIRDLLIGQVPPMMFRNPIYVMIAVIVANIVFCAVYVLHKQKTKVNENYTHFYERILFWFDTLGLAAFTVDGVSAGVHTENQTSLFLIVFVGVLTGVGGGVLRDVMANRLPAIFVRHIYAIASLVGAVLTGLLWKMMGEDSAMAVGFLFIIVIRYLAAKYNWNLPKIKKDMM